jgi:hypothetical protein
LLLGQGTLADSVLLLLGFFLVLNGLTARCYLWRWLGISSLRKSGGCALNTQDRPEV